MKEESSKKEQGRSFCKEFVNKIEPQERTSTLKSQDINDPCVTAAVGGETCRTECIDCTGVSQR